MKSCKRGHGAQHLIQRVGAALRQERARLRVPQHVILRHPVHHLRTSHSDKWQKPRIPAPGRAALKAPAPTLSCNPTGHQSAMLRYKRCTTRKQCSSCSCWGARVSGS